MRNLLVMEGHWHYQSCWVCNHIYTYDNLEEMMSFIPNTSSHLPEFDEKNAVSTEFYKNISVERKVYAKKETLLN